MAKGRLYTMSYIQEDISLPKPRHENFDDNILTLQN
jgi:hypothetical protein